MVGLIILAVGMITVSLPIHPPIAIKHNVIFKNAYIVAKQKKIIIM